MNRRIHISREKSYTEAEVQALLKKTAAEVEKNASIDIDALTEAVKTATIASIVDTQYPVGRIYISTTPTDPSLIFPGTSWTEIKGRFLIGEGENEENTTDYWGTMPAANINCPPGEMGGEAWHKLTAAESGVPAHKHPVQSNVQQGYQSGSNKNGYNAGGSNPGNLTPGCQNNTAQDASKSHNNMPPYLAVYMWERTA